MSEEKLWGFAGEGGRQGGGDKADAFCWFEEVALTTLLKRPLRWVLSWSLD